MLDGLFPETKAEWQALGGGVVVPAYYFRGHEASGDLVDDVQGLTDMVASAAPEYEQTLAGYDNPFLKITETATEGFAAQAGELWNTNSQSVVYTTYFKLDALPGALRVLLMLAGAGGYVSINGSGIIQLRNSGVTTGAYDYNDGELHFVRVGYQVGSPVLGRADAGVYKLWTDQEVLTGTWERLPDDIKGLGGCGAFTPPPALYGPQEISIGSDAEALIALNASDMAHRGWTLAY